MYLPGCTTYDMRRCGASIDAMPGLGPKRYRAFNESRETDLAQMATSARNDPASWTVSDCVVTGTAEPMNTRVLILLIVCWVGMATESQTIFRFDVSCATFSKPLLASHF